MRTHRIGIKKARVWETQAVHDIVRINGDMLMVSKQLEHWTLVFWGQTL